jgi:hypothetical protein
MYKKQFELIKAYSVLNISKYEMTISPIITLSHWIHYITVTTLTLLACVQFEIYWGIQAASAVCCDVRHPPDTNKISRLIATNCGRYFIANCT